MQRSTALSFAAFLTAAAALAACTPEIKTPSGQADYQQYCSACHGATGKGDGPAAKDLTPKPADLTLLARKNGGTFPRLQSMGHIHGHTAGRSESPMPEFGDILTGPSVPYDAGDGILTPTPERLVALSKYLEKIQVK
ncbi:c-type cytochrome [Paracoccus sp. (in: a-proteobacteria)]|uniref:c-type cytochrome n=1 Tax=Paracoccus sp. TaxID=267 RepID=UPI00289EF98A|nr:c-type cytochrome [Paracoccus sp. (in: a-proteobacteria)]